MSTPKVLNAWHVGKQREGAVYIGRPSKWGNPYVIGRDGDRADVIAKYRAYLTRDPALMEAARNELRGKDLICYCAPAACHGDILLLIANEEDAVRSALRQIPPLLPPNRVEAIIRDRLSERFPEERIQALIQEFRDRIPHD